MVPPTRLINFAIQNLRRQQGVGQERGKGLRQGALRCETAFGGGVEEGGK